MFNRGSEDDDLDVSTQNKTEDNQEGVDDDFLYSKHSVTSEIDKGRAVQQQISKFPRSVSQLSFHMSHSMRFVL